MLKLHSLNKQHACSFLADTFAILARHNVAVDLVTTSEVSIAITLDSTSSTSGDADALTTSLLTELSSRCRVEVEEDLALVTLIGNQLARETGGCNGVFAELENHNVRMICFGASSHNICFLVPAADADRAVISLHDRLFG